MSQRQIIKYSPVPGLELVEIHKVTEESTLDGQQPASGVGEVRLEVADDSTSDAEQSASDQTVVDVNKQRTDSSTRDDATPMTMSVEGVEEVRFEVTDESTSDVEQSTSGQTLADINKQGTDSSTRHDATSDKAVKMEGAKKLEEMNSYEREQYVVNFQQKIQEGNDDEVRRLLANNPDLVKSKCQRLYPLHVAAKYNHSNIVRILLDEGADVNQQTRDEDGVEDITAVHIAVQMTDGKRCATQRQLSHDNEDNQSQAPVLTSTMEQTTVELLISHPDINPNIKDKRGETPLHYSVRCCNEQTTVELLMNHPDINPNIKNYKGETSLHYAAGLGNAVGCNILLNDTRVGVNLLIQNGANVQARNWNKTTPLHLACQNGHNNVVRELVTYKATAIHDENNQGYTVLHCAAENGHFDIVQFLIEKGTPLDAVNKRRGTALHHAASNGWAKTCQILIDNVADVTITARPYRRTPLQAACVEGHKKVVEILLQPWNENRTVSHKDWEYYVTHRDNRRMNCLDLAIEKGHKEIAKMIVETEGVWELVLQNDDFDHFRDEETTPMRELIRHMPGVAGTVFNKCIRKLKPGDEDDKRFVFNYTYLDDQNERHTWARDGRLEHKYKPGEYMNTHVLTKLAKSERRELLFHPLVSALLLKKSLSRVMYIFYLHLLLYLIFLGFLTAYMVSSIPPYELLLQKELSDQFVTVNNYRENNATNFKLAGNDTLCEQTEAGGYRQSDNVTALQASNGTLCEQTEARGYRQSGNVTALQAGNGTLCEQAEAGGHRQSDNVTALQYLTLTFSAILFLSEVIKWCLKKMSYLKFDSMIELIVFSFAMIVTINFTTCSEATGYRYTWQWSMGTASLFFGWINFALYLQKFTYFGIYIVMFKHILKTFQKFIIVYVLFVIAFALAFYSEMRSLTPYKTFGLSFVKTVVMMTGEFNYGNDFFVDDFVANDLLNKMAVYILFVCFIIVMTILVMNLLIGLAVGDITEIQRKADVKRLQMQIDLVLDLEGVARALPCSKMLMGDKRLMEVIDLKKTKLRFNLDKYVGMKSLTLEAAESAKKTKKSEIQEEQQYLRQQSDKLKERLKEQNNKLKSLDETLKERFEEQANELKSRDKALIERFKEQANELKSLDKALNKRFKEQANELKSLDKALDKRFKEQANKLDSRDEAQTKRLESLEKTLKLVLERLPKPQQ